MLIVGAVLPFIPLAAVAVALGAAVGVSEKTLVLGSSVNTDKGSIEPEESDNWGEYLLPVPQALGRIWVARLAKQWKTRA